MVNRSLQYYNLDMIISVGYRVNYHRDTHSNYTFETRQVGSFLPAVGEL